MIKIGDQIMVRGCFGMGEAQPATVVRMEVTKEPRQKNGAQVDNASIEMVKSNRVLFAIQYEGAETGNWCYSEQVVINA